jgi:tetratricopeptide (TPR) repeat protein
MLAVELTFAGDWPLRRSLADEALAMARRLKNANTLQRVVGVLYFSICVPETLEERLAMTAEALASADGESDPFALHWVHRWRLYACAEAADIDAIDALLPEVVRYGQATRDPYTIWTLTLDESCRSLLAGHFDEAERKALEGFQIGTDSGQGEAAGAYAVQLFEVRRQQGRASEVDELLTTAVAQYPHLPLARAALASLSCEIGNGARAADLLHSDAVDGFAHVPYDLFWAYSMGHYAEVSSALHQHQPSQELYDRLAPWHRQLSLIPWPVSCGAIALYLGMLATVLERFDDAEAHFAEAMEIHERMRAPYWIARTQLEPARMLLARGGPDDNSRSVALLDQVETTAGQYGFAALTRHSTGLRL